ncbi:BglG family transcription antiterminator [Companilactobacillus hulinensis]|uniref:BglG family transcription antiterminator n=1 Tax=Companilactobacillus hulinensis TaxID=2486007 RepID=UPI000F77E1B4|nr:BglG family transcription antiterminator [Companilactobacillus hulinensis]
MNLNKRQIQLVLILVGNEKKSDLPPLNAHELSNRLKVSTKTIYSDLSNLKPFFKKFDVQLIKKPRIGVYLEGKDSDLLKVLTNIELKNNNQYLDDETRRELVFSQLLNSDSYLTLQDLADKYYVNRQTISEDIDNVELKIKPLGVHLQRKLGKGIRFDIDENHRRKLLTRLIEKQFFKKGFSTFSNQKLSILTDSSFSISQELITTVDEILRRFISDKEMILNDYEYQSLLVHLLIAIERVRKGKFVTSGKWGSAKAYSSESQELINLLESTLNIKFPKEEIYYLQLHLVAAGEKKFNKVPSKLNDDNLLLDYLKTGVFDKQLYQGLLLHINSAMNRWRLGISINNPYTKEIMQKYSNAYEMAVHLKESYENHYGLKINDDETAYLALHFEAFLERNRSDRDSFRIIIVCSTGLGTSQLLAARIKNDFPELKIVSIYSYEKYLKASLKNIELIISTIELPQNDKPIIYVSPVTSTEDLKNKIGIVEGNLKSNLIEKQPFLKLISRDNILLRDTNDWQESIKILCNHLESQKILKPNAELSAIKREQLSFTSFDNLATPHANPKFVNTSHIAVLKTNEAIVWGTQKVNLIFFIALKDNLKQSELDQIYDRFWDILSDKKLIKKIVQSDNVDEIFELLRG